MMRVVVTGDKSRYHFFRSILEEKEVGNKDAFFTEKLGSMDVFLTSDAGMAKENIYYSGKIPPNTLLYFPGEYTETTDVYHNRDKVIFFDEFPYATDEKMKKMEDVVQNESYSQLEVVLFQNERSGLESDISTDAMALEEAEARYREKNILICRYHVNDFPFFLFLGWNDNETRFGDAFFRKLRLVRNDLETFESFYDLEYSFPDEEGKSMESLVDFDNLLNFFCFENSMRGKDVWKVYFNKSYDFYWEENPTVKKFCKRLYFSSMEGICIWDKEKDFEGLFDIIKKEYKAQFSQFGKLVYNGEKRDYEEFLNKNKKEILEFRTRIQRFFQESLKKLLKDRIEKNLDKLEVLMECK